MTERCTCGCSHPRPQRFGEALLCMRDECLGAWVYQTSKKFSAAKYRIDVIKNVSLDNWLDFLQFFRGYCWTRVTEGAAQGISVYDIANATDFWLNQANRESRHIPSLPITQPQDSPDSEDHAEAVAAEANTLMESTELSPYQNALLHEVCENIGDDTLVLLFSDQVTAVDAAMLLGVGNAALPVYAQTVLEEVRKEYGR